MGFDFGTWMFGRATDPTADYMKGLNAQWGAPEGNRDLNYGRSNAFYNQLIGGGAMDPSAWMNQALGYSPYANQMMRGASDSANRGGTDIFNAFSQVQPGMMGMAGDVANRATTRFEGSMMDLANQQSRDALRTLENRLGAGGAFGTSSGAALSALARGAATPLMEAQTNINNMYSNAFQNAYNPMAQMGYGRELNRTNEFLQALQGANQSMSTLGGQGQGLANLLGQQSEQIIYMPQWQQQEGMFGNILGAALGGGTGWLGNKGLDWISSLFNKE